MNAAVIVPVRGGDRDTVPALRAIGAAARAAGARFVVVDNGIAPEVRRGLGGIGAEVVACATVGSYAARNVGVAAALHEGTDAVLFTDADCHPEPGWPGHLLDLLCVADVVTATAAPREVGPLGVGAATDYRERLADWSGGAVRCGEPVNTMDTRAAAVRADLLRDRRFDTRLRFAGDAVFGRTARAAGARVVGCPHGVLSHDPPRSWSGELRKYRDVAASLVDDLRAIPRREVLRLLPEHAHLLLPPPPSAVAGARERMAGAVRAFDRDDSSRAAALYRAVRELGWTLGWLHRHRERAGGEDQPRR